MENLKGNKAHRTPGAPYFLLSRFALTIGAHYGFTPDPYDSRFRSKLRKTRVSIKNHPQLEGGSPANLRALFSAPYFERVTQNSLLLFPGQGQKHSIINRDRRRKYRRTLSAGERNLLG